MATTNNAQMWQSSRFNVERVCGDTPSEVIFRFTGPFTARDMYGSITPAALREILHSPADPEPTNHILDLSRVPYIDSAGLGIIVDHFSKCQKAGIRMTAVGAGPRVIEQFRLTKIDTLFPVTA
jgi:anti-anti-sigma factor